MRYQRAGVTLFCLVLILGVLSACYPGRATSGSGANPNLIGNWELQNLPDLTALEAIRRLRPNWLRTGSRPSIAVEGGGSRNPRVHLNGVPLQNLNELDQINAVDIREMRYLNGSDATTRFGTGYMNGAILVTMET